MTDFRLMPALVGAWAGALAGARLSSPGWLAAAAVLVAVACVTASLPLLHRAAALRPGRNGCSALQPRQSSRWMLVAGCVCGAASLLGAGARAQVRSDDYLARLAARGAEVSLEVVVTGDPIRLQGAVSGAHRLAGGLLLPARAELVAIGADAVRLRHPVTVLARGGGWSERLPGERLRMQARLVPARSRDPVAAVARAHGAPVLLARAGPVQRSAGRFRAGLRAAADGLPADARGLLPGLVIGDTSRLPGDLREDFQITGMTHLVAVSGSNAALFLALALLLTRRTGASIGVTALAGGLALAFFVVLARPSPSVLRAAVMGGIALVSLVSGRGRAGFSALAGAVLLLLLVDPGLASSAGFALSSAATAGLILLAPGWRSHLGEHLPRWLADAVAVPLAAQVACLPVLVGLFGEVSLVAVPANLLAVPAVGMATVVGVAAALVAPVALPIARLLALVAAAPTLWLAWVARTFAVVPHAQLPWPSGLLGATAMVALLTLAPRAIRRRRARRTIATALLTALLALVAARAVLPGWPPSGWLMAACDVGQGDGIVVRGRSAVLVVDTGPEPAAMSRCLDDLGVGDISALVLTHLHADHVEGLPGALQGRDVAEIVTGPLDEPLEEWARVRRWADESGVRIRRAAAGERWTVGDLAVAVLGPAAAFRGTSSDPNNSSLVLAVEVGATRLLLTGDIETPAQQAVLSAATSEQLRADVLKTAHHGSSRQVAGFAAGVGASVAVTSVGADNPYGHPAPATMAALDALGMRSLRTDRHGDVVVGRAPSGVLFAAARRSRPADLPARARALSRAARRAAAPQLFCRVPRAPPYEDAPSASRPSAHAPLRPPARAQRAILHRCLWCR
ncbi:MAG TPA: DNA internalization-related competence protein ComEC/Rec2 [Mycobacteriales bacterium]|nr:DNA internalization-related competence protein ComEC/Rec2 [Mycobacteriales bacterium]